MNIIWMHSLFIGACIGAACGVVILCIHGKCKLWLQQKYMREQWVARRDHLSRQIGYSVDSSQVESISEEEARAWVVDVTFVVDQVKVKKTVQLDKYPVTQIKDQDDVEEDLCVVRTEPLQVGQEIRTLPCSHRFHLACIDSWLVRRITCLLCNLELETYEETEAGVDLPGVVATGQSLSNVTDSKAGNETSLRSLPMGNTQQPMEQHGIDAEETEESHVAQQRQQISQASAEPAGTRVGILV